MGRINAGNVGQRYRSSRFTTRLSADRRPAVTRERMLTRIRLASQSSVTFDPEIPRGSARLYDEAENPRSFTRNGHRRVCHNFTCFLEINVNSTRPEAATQH